jgi:membrane protein
LKDTAAIERAREYLRIFPPVVFDTFIGNLESILTSGQVFSVISFLFLIYFAFKVFNSLEHALNIIYETNQVRKEWKAKLKAFMFFLVTSFVLVFLFISGSVYLVLAAKLERIPLVKSYYVLLMGDIAVETLFFSLSYKYLSNRKLSLKNALVGGFVATVLWEILKHIFGIYIVSLNRYSIIYGSIGSIILLQLWLYYSILAYLFGAEVSAGLS